MTAMDTVLEARGLTKRFGKVVAVDDVSLAVPHGAVLGLVGRNGAGKSTLLRLLTGLLRPDRGEARLAGRALRPASAAERARIACCGQDIALPPAMTIAQLAYLTSAAYPRWDAALAERLLRRWELPATRAIGAFSTGQRQRVGLLLALAARPEVLVLDEPAAGLDPVARHQLLEELAEALAMPESCTVVLSTHLIADLDGLADRIAVLEQGRLVLEAPRDELQQTYRRIQLVYPGPVPTSLPLPAAMPREVRGQVVSATGALSAQELATLEALPAVRVDTWPMSLEEILVAIMTAAPAGAPLPPHAGAALAAGGIP